MNKSKKYQLLSFLLATIFLMTTFLISCAEKTDVTDSGGTTNSETQTSPAEDLFYDLPTGDYEEQEFTILNGQVAWSYDEMYADTLDADLLGAAIYKRNRRVENDLNIKIVVENVPDDKTISLVKKAVGAGDDIYDAVFSGAYRIAPSGPKKWMCDLKLVEGLNLSKPWWDQNGMASYIINDELFMIHGNLQIAYFEGLWTLMFNKKIHEDLSLKDPYELVKKGEWTIDEMIAMMTAASMQVDGYEIGDSRNQFGLLTHIGAAWGFLHGFDERFIKFDEEQYPYLSPLNDHLYDRIEFIKSLFTDTVITGLREIVAKDVDDFPHWIGKKFIEGGGLFMAEVLGNVAGLREMEVDFGLLPFPKYDLEQSEYISYISPASSAMCIPLSCVNTKRSGTVLENMCAASYEILMPAYYEKTLRGKNVRDSESVEMLDIMFKNIECEVGYIYNWQGLNAKYKDIIMGIGEPVSTIEAIRDGMNQDIDKVFKIID